MCFGYSEEDKILVAELCAEEGKKTGERLLVPNLPTTNSPRFVTCGSPELALKDEPRT